MKDILNFLSELKANNCREWFNDNKERYNAVKKSVESLTENLLAMISGFDSEASGLRVADCTYRIYSDTRFSSDKTPFKTHIGIFINPPKGKKSFRSGYYLHIEPGNCLFAAGNIGLPSGMLKAVRQSIYDEIEEYRSIVESEDFKKTFPSIGENMLKTAPKGFPKDWEFIDYLKPKDFCCSCPISDKTMLSPKLLKTLEPIYRRAKRYNDFINYAIDDFEENMNAKA